MNNTPQKLMDKLQLLSKQNGCVDERLELFIARTLFCLFIDDIKSYRRDEFHELIKNTPADDLGNRLSQLFDVLRIHPKNRSNIDEQLSAFPYFTNPLFHETCPAPNFTSEMRNALLACFNVDWYLVSPIIFGSAYQNITKKEIRRQDGAHYTDTKNILRVLRPLFLDELWQEFKSADGAFPELQLLYTKIKSLRFLDPACGCGNFLVVAYYELRQIELAILRHLYANARLKPLVNASQFYGIELDARAAHIADAAMFIAERQMDCAVCREFGVPSADFEYANIKIADALQTEWHVHKIRFDYIFGNPPFLGSHMMSRSQKSALLQTFQDTLYDTDCATLLDYITGWFAKAVHLMKGSRMRAAFVSTNSIIQGQQPCVLFPKLWQHGFAIHFAHRSFKWMTDTKCDAVVCCVIIGFGLFDIQNKRIFVYDDWRGEPRETPASNINPYLIDAPNVIITRRKSPLCPSAPKMCAGNNTVDDNHLIMDEIEMQEFIAEEPRAAKYIMPFISSYYFLHGMKRYCLWLAGVAPEEYSDMPAVMKRVDAVRNFRLARGYAAGRKLAETPAEFRETRRFDNYIFFPATTGYRKIIPAAFITDGAITCSSCRVIPNGNLYHFGMMMSAMHMAWILGICLRRDKGFSYSVDIVYNNFPWSSSNKFEIEKCAQSVLDARALFPNKTLYDLYPPIGMPAELIDAHAKLNAAVDVSYRQEPFASAETRFHFLFNLYADMISNRRQHTIF